MVTTNELPHMLDMLNDAFFQGKNITDSEKEKASQLFLSRQIRSGAYSGLFAPTRAELDAGIRLFTGERLHTHLGPRNVFSAEIGRFCLLLGLTSPGITEALERLNERLLVSCFVSDLCTVGECAHSGSGFMRYVAAGGIPDSGKRLDAHLLLLANTRDGKGGWLHFPFHYTLLALTEMDLPAAVSELRYAAAHRGKTLHKAGTLEKKYLARRQMLWERVLARC